MEYTFPTEFIPFNNGIRVSLGGNWNINDIISELEKENNESIFTCINYDKYRKLRKKTTIKRYSFINYVRTISSLKTVYSEESTENFYNIIKQNNEYLKVITLKDYNIYDKNLEILFSKRIINKIIQSLLYYNNEQIKIGIYSAGMSEINIVTIGYIYLKLMGHEVEPRIDLGVDNIRKTKSIIDTINNNDIIITTAGMEAVLPTVIADISYKPVIGVPSIVSYGMGGNGIAGINSILITDSPGIAVFNISNIYGGCIFANNIAIYLKKRMMSIEPRSIIRFNKSNYEIRYIIDKTMLDTSFNRGITVENKQIEIIKGDIANSVRYNIPILRVNDKTETQIRLFMNHKMYLLIEDGSTSEILDKDDRFKLITTQEELPEEEFFKVRINKKIMYFRMNSIIRQQRQEYYDTEKVAIICGGYGDQQLAIECSYYLRINSIKVDIFNYISVNNLVLHDEEFKKILDQYSIFIVIAGNNGTISNLVGSIIKTKPIIAIPNSDEIYTTQIMLQNCVAGIAVIGNKNVYSASSLALSIMFNQTI